MWRTNYKFFHSLNCTSDRGKFPAITTTIWYAFSLRVRAIPRFEIFHSNGEQVKYKHVAGYSSHCSLMRGTAQLLRSFRINAWFALNILILFTAWTTKLKLFTAFFIRIPVLRALCFRFWIEASEQTIKLTAHNYILSVRRRLCVSYRDGVWRVCVCGGFLCFEWQSYN